MVDNELQRGSIVLVDQVTDPQGRNPKDRFAVVLNQDCVGDGLLFVVMITSRKSDDVAEYLVEMPFAEDGTCRTGLIRKSFAACH